VTVGGIAATVTGRTATQVTATAPSLWTNPSMTLGPAAVVLTTGGVALGAGSVLYVPRFTIQTDGTIGTLAADHDWLPQARAGADNTTSDWGAANVLTELYLGYDEAFLYIGILGKAQKQNAVVGYIWEDGLTSLTRPGASANLSDLHDYAGDGSGDGNGCYFQNPTCQANYGQPLSLDNNLSGPFSVKVADWKAHYAFGRTGNAVDLPGPAPGRHNAAGVRNLASVTDFGWSDSVVRHTESASEFAIPWGTFAREPSRTITTVKLFVRLVGRNVDNTPVWAHQGLPADANSRAGSGDVTGVATLLVRGNLAPPF